MSNNIGSQGRRIVPSGKGDKEKAANGDFVDQVNPVIGCVPRSWPKGGAGTVARIIWKSPHRGGLVGEGGDQEIGLRPAEGNRNTVRRSSR